MSELRPLQRLADFGQSVWIDYLSRDLLASGELARLIRDSAVVGVTSNPTIFEKAIAHGDAYDEQLRELLPRELNAKEVFLELASADVAAACDLFRPVWEQTVKRDGYVSIEVDPNLAYDAQAQYEEAQRLHEGIARANLLVKIPATKPGVVAIEDSIAAGRSINVTLVFSVER
jgi:transaldolase